MFSVYGKAGRVFRGSMEELRRVSPPSALARAQGVRAVGLDPKEQSPPHLPICCQRRLAMSCTAMPWLPMLRRCSSCRASTIGFGTLG